jgi:UDP-GlcNAc:undecaprenyl-phosphate GlcNAc-1-phosphate transferase
MNIGHGQRRSVLILWLWTALLSAVALYPVFTTSGATLATLGILAVGLGLFTILHPEVRKTRALHATNGASGPVPAESETTDLELPETAR